MVCYCLITHCFFFSFDIASHNSLINFTLLDCWVGTRYELSWLWVCSPCHMEAIKTTVVFLELHSRPLKHFLNFFLSCVFVLKLVKSRLVVHQLTSFWQLNYTIINEIWYFCDHYFDLWANLAWNKGFHKLPHIY